eukprot:Blabericola_migrator_1__1125@NODE_128_length_13299_cov_164_804867_g113_i0_p5_GENE_NODE_128_length_13299_cov_164_804867_g113_i0NODE_128_length_13299_cov_164_804867_g113_i0_p5_ORF_typecomplete_len363_score89_91GP67/PF17634_2/2_2_NODE_128_length_13299_cov_164_804867_g113_i051996287
MKLLLIGAVSALAETFVKYQCEALVNLATICHYFNEPVIINDQLTLAELLLICGSVVKKAVALNDTGGHTDTGMTQVEILTSHIYNESDPFFEWGYTYTNHRHFTPISISHTDMGWVVDLDIDRVSVSRDTFIEQLRHMNISLALCQDLCHSWLEQGICVKAFPCTAPYDFNEACTSQPKHTKKKTVQAPTRRLTNRRRKRRQLMSHIPHSRRLVDGTSVGPLFDWALIDIEQVVASDKDTFGDLDTPFCAAGEARNETHHQIVSSATCVSAGVTVTMAVTAVAQHVGITQSKVQVVEVSDEAHLEPASEFAYDGDEASNEDTDGDSDDNEDGGNKEYEEWEDAVMDIQDFSNNMGAILFSY